MDTRCVMCSQSDHEVVSWSGRAKRAEWELLFSEQRRLAGEGVYLDIRQRFSALREEIRELAKEMERPWSSGTDYDIGYQSACEVYAFELFQLLEKTSGLGLDDITGEPSADSRRSAPEAEESEHE
jgi:hypothetical protein